MKYTEFIAELERELEHPPTKAEIKAALASRGIFSDPIDVRNPDFEDFNLDKSDPGISISENQNRRD